MQEEVVGLNAGWQQMDLMQVAAVGLNAGDSSWTEYRGQQVD